jgi:hypothetical protein
MLDNQNAGQIARSERGADFDQIGEQAVQAMSQFFRPGLLHGAGGFA